MAGSKTNFQFLFSILLKQLSTSILKKLQTISAHQEGIHVSWLHRLVVKEFGAAASHHNGSEKGSKRHDSKSTVNGNNANFKPTGDFVTATVEQSCQVNEWM